jgi:cytoskeleton protein RodZ
VQLTTDRAVWMRVIVDGQKILEREVPAGQHLTYTPAGSIVIRAGDAGGVRVKIGSGPEEVLGRNAFPVTRRFDIPKP